MSAQVPPRRSAAFRMAGRSWALPALIFLFVFFVAPLLRNAWISLSDSGQVTDMQAAGMWGYYVRLFTDPFYLGVLLETLKVSVITTALCLLVGYPVAYFMVRYAGRWNAFIVFCLIAPLLTSIIMRTFGWQVLFARRGLFNTWLMDMHVIARPLNILDSPVSVYVGLVHVLCPFMVLSITAVLQGLDTRLEEAARVLGAGPWRSFRHVTWPLGLEGVLTGSILVFVLTNGMFLTMLLLGGGTVKTLALLIYQQFNLTQDVGFASAMGNVLLLFALLGLFVQSWIKRRSAL